MNTAATSMSTLKIPDSLGTASLDIPNIPDDIIFPDELNRYLRSQIQYYAHENGMLKNNLYDLELQYNNCLNKQSELECKLSTYEKLDDKYEFTTSNQVASSKIVELSKKLRERNSETESWRTKCSRLEKQLFQLTSVPESSEKITEIQESPSNESEIELKKLRDKLSSTNSKLSESRNMNLQLKHEMKVATRLLQQEIGDSFESLQTFVSSNSSWRGRAQIICDIQQKNSNLREKLKLTQDGASSSSLDSNQSLCKIDSKVSFLSKENEDLKAKYEEFKKKNDALRARCRVLDTDYTLSKSKVLMLTEQSERDQDIITTLSNQISYCRDSRNEVILQKEQVIKKQQNDQNKLLKELDEYRAIIKNMGEDLKSQSTVQTNQSERSNKERTGDQSEELKLVKLLEEQNVRLIAEREAHGKTQNRLRIEKQRGAKAEALVSRVELESNRSGCYSSISTLRSLDPNLRDKLELAEENLKALQTRLEIEQFERRADLAEFSKILKQYEKK